MKDDGEVPLYRSREVPSSSGHGRLLVSEVRFSVLAALTEVTDDDSCVKVDASLLLFVVVMSALDLFLSVVT